MPAILLPLAPAPTMYTPLRLLAEIMLRSLAVVPPMALSRLYLGVHYPSDVAAGAALGALTVRLGARWMNGGAAR